MPKKIVQDIVPGERRSIRKIYVDQHEEPSQKINRRKMVRPIEDDEINEIEEIVVSGKKPKAKRRAGSFKYVISFFIIILSIVLIGVALSLSYSKAVVTVTPKKVNFDINGTFTAKKSTPSEELGYEVIIVSASTTKTLQATKGANIQTKAKGAVTIYNNFSTTSQILVAGTRIDNEDGLVYRTANSVTIPGKKTTTPGSTSVTVVADQFGEKYNIKLTDLKGDFKLPGFKGTPKYGGFYARSKTDILGGFLGNKMSINEDLKMATIQSTKDILKEELLEKLNKNVTADFILYDGAYNIDYVVSEPKMRTASEADINITATAYGAIFRSDLLIKYIAGKEVRKFPSSTYNITGNKELVFKISNPKDFSIRKGNAMIFTLKGPVTITGTFSEDKLKEELKGTKLEGSNLVFSKYPSIANAYVLITPFWLRSFPNAVDKIKVEYKH